MRVQLVVWGVVSAAVVGCGGGGGGSDGGGGGAPPSACSWARDRHCSVVPASFQAKMPDYCAAVDGGLVASCPEVGVQATCTVAGATPYMNRFYDDYVGDPSEFLVDRGNCWEDDGEWVEPARPIELTCALHAGGSNYCMDVYGPNAADGCRELTALSSPCPVDETTKGMCFIDNGADGAYRVYAYAGDTYVESECEDEGGVWTPVL